MTDLQSQDAAPIAGPWAAAARAHLKNVLVVEDEGLIAVDLKRRLERYGYTVPAIAATADSAVRLASEHLPDLVLMDIRLRGQRDGIEAAHEVREKLDIPVIFVTANGDRETIERAKGASPFGYIVKPFGSIDFRGHLETAHAKHDLERRLRRSEAWLAATLRSVGDGVIAADQDGCVRFMNRAAELMTGWKNSEAEGRLLFEVVELRDERTLDAVPNPALMALDPDGVGRYWGTYHLYHRNGGEPFTVEAVASVNQSDDDLLGAIVAFRNVTEQRRLEKEALSQGKSETLSTVAGALARDFDMLFGNFRQACSAAIHRSRGHADLTEEMRRAEERAADYTRQLRELGKKDRSCDTVFDLNAETVLKAEVLRSILGPKRTLVLRTAETPCRIRAAAEDIETILDSLTQNARKAMPCGGTLTIATVNAGDRVKFVISDDGIGMDAAERRRIFDPFARVLSSEAPTALGLAAVKAIVTRLGGSISVQSEPGRGTTFTSEFPSV